MLRWCRRLKSTKWILILILLWLLLCWLKSSKVVIIWSTKLWLREISKLVLLLLLELILLRLLLHAHSIECIWLETTWLWLKSSSRIWLEWLLVLLLCLTTHHAHSTHSLQLIHSTHLTHHVVASHLSTHHSLTHGLIHSLTHTLVHASHRSTHLVGILLTRHLNIVKCWEFIICVVRVLLIHLVKVMNVYCLLAHVGSLIAAHINSCLSWITIIEISKTIITCSK